MAWGFFVGQVGSQRARALPTSSQQVQHKETAMKLMRLKKLTIAALLLTTSALRADAVGDLISVLASAGYTSIEVRVVGGLYHVEADLDGVEYHMVYDPSVGAEPISVTMDDSSDDDHSDDGDDGDDSDDDHDDDHGEDDDHEDDDHEDDDHGDDGDDD